MQTTVQATLAETIVPPAGNNPYQKNPPQQLLTPHTIVNVAAAYCFIPLSHIFNCIIPKRFTADDSRPMIGLLDFSTRSRTAFSLKCSTTVADEVAKTRSCIYDIHKL